MTSPSDLDKSRAEAVEIEREMELIRRHRERTPPAQPARRILTLVTTALIAVALWLAMR